MSKKKKKNQNSNQDLNNFNIDDILSSNEPLEAQVEDMQILNKARGIDDTVYLESLVKYMYANEENIPIKLEKIITDGDARLKEISTMNAISYQLSINKLDKMEQYIIDELAKNIENTKFMSSAEQMNILNSISNVREKRQRLIFEHLKLSADFNSMPTIYRQLVAKLMMYPENKADRIKLIPDLLELPDEIWCRIVEILNLWNKE